MPQTIALFGTGDFALPTFSALIEQGNPVVTAVYTQPDRKGRGHHRHVNQVKELALQHGIDVLQPDNVNSPESLSQLKELNADLYVVAAYGQILKPEFLQIPKLGAFNLHGSVLPKHRGAAPVQYSIWKGDRVGGVTMFQIEAGLDCGPVVGVTETEIGPEETSGDLMARLAELSIPLTKSTVAALLSGTAEFRPQDHQLATKAPKIRKEQGVINWAQTSAQIDCHIRAMQPWPKAVSELRLADRKPLPCQVFSVQLLDDGSFADVVFPEAAPGQIHVTEKSSSVGRRLLVRTGDGWLQVNRLQLTGKKSMDADALINGYGVKSGDGFRNSEQ